MAEDFDVEAMLEAPYVKSISTVGSGSRDSETNRSSLHGDGDEKRAKSSKCDSRTCSSDHNGRKNVSRSRSGSRDDDDRKQYRHSNVDREKGKDRDRYRSKDRDRERKRSSRDRERERHCSRSREGRVRSRDGRRTRSKDKKSTRPHSERKSSRSRDYRRSRSKDRRHRDHLSPIKERGRSRSYRRSRSPERSNRRHSGSPRPFRRGRTPPNGLGPDRSPQAELSPEERDARTIFCMQLSQRVRARDLEEFFSSVGKVRDVRLITCNKTKRFKGIAYIEFKDPESVALALGLSGQRLLGIPIVVQHTQAEKNRIANAVPTFTPKNHTGPMRLYVGSLHFNITEDMMRGIFEPFGKIDTIQLIMDTETGRSKGYGFITRVRARDLEEFFSSVGKVRDVRLITCNKTKRFKGIAYIEFKDPESVALALGLSGQRLLGIPIVVQHTQAEKNRIANAVPTFTPKNHTGPMRLYVGSLHFNITEDMMRGIFEPFGKIDTIQLIMDTETGRSKGYGFITYHNAEDAKKALEQLNGFELAGRPMKVGNVTERLDMNTSSLDTDEMDRSGIDLGATGRLQLMFKLAEGAGLAVPQAAANALLATAPQPVPINTQAQNPPIATQCFLLSNMFDPRTETNPNWDSEIRDDVVDECSKHGGVLHMFVDKVTPTGNVYVKCPSITTAVLAVNALHGRWFAGRVIGATYVPLLNYHSMFPDAITAINLLTSNRKSND